MKISIKKGPLSKGKEKYLLISQVFKLLAVGISASPSLKENEKRNLKDLLGK